MMKSLKKYSTLLIVLASLGLGLGINYWSNLGNVPACIKSPGCQEEKLGTLKTKKYGYPRTYKEVVSFEPNFEPNDKSSYAAVSTEIEGFSWPNVIINAIFWYALIVLCVGVYNSQSKKKK